MLLGVAGAAARTGAPLRFLVHPAMAPELEALGVAVEPLSGGHGARRLFEARRRLRTARPAAALLLDNLSLASGVPEVVFVANALVVTPGSRFDARARWFRASAGRVSSFVAPNRALERAVVERTGARCVTAPLGVEPPPEGERPVRVPRRVLHIGLPSPQKNLEAVVRSFALLAPDVELRWNLPVDSEEGRRLAALAGDLGVAGRITWLGHLAPDDLWRELASASAFLFPSYLESYGLPAVEALSVGTPVVSAERPWARAVFEDAALFADPDDPAALASLVTEVLDDVTLRARLSAAGVGLTATRTWDAMLGVVMTELERAALDR